MLRSIKCSERSHDCLDSRLFDRLMPRPLPNQPGTVRSVAVDHKLLVLVLVSTFDSSELTATAEELALGSDASSIQLSAELLPLKELGVRHTLLFIKTPVASEVNASDAVGQLGVRHTLLFIKTPVASEVNASDAVGQLFEWLFSVC